MCAHAELAAAHDIEGLFGTKTWVAQTAAVLGTGCVVGTLCNLMCGLGSLFSPCVCTAYHTQIRDAVKRKSTAGPDSKADLPGSRSRPLGICTWHSAAGPRPAPDILSRVDAAELSP